MRRNTTISIALRDDQVADLRALADRRFGSLSQVCRQLLAEGLERETPEPRPSQPRERTADR